ncbi:NAD(P)H-dependent oxidoreductase [uncultured Nocardioides sp.]|uniref:NAD(P)H-dependent oxidoreductase n=1 Tax=uncultured Nocardioides sp. TaxID=198441 RepID=UPI0026357050|nr:NAD(P)H-dependent oxidoreductase [uncultured Nocardioides sp.]
MTTTVAVLVGSLRADSVNRRVAERLRDDAPEGVRLEIVEGLDLLPFYNEDVDVPGRTPEAAVRLRDQVGAADRVLAVTPEYNGTMPAVLNNALDWLSRPYGAGAVVGKPFGVVGVTPTPYGGKWSHADAARSAGIAGAAVVEDVTVSQSSIDVDVLGDEAVQQRLSDALATLVAAEAQPAAA